MFRYIEDIIAMLPTRSGSGPSRWAGQLSDAMYWLGYAVGIIIQFAAGFAIGAFIKAIICAIF